MVPILKNADCDYTVENFFGSLFFEDFGLYLQVLCKGSRSKRRQKTATKNL